MTAPDRFKHYADSIDRAVKNGIVTSYSSGQLSSTTNSITSTMSTVNGYGLNGQPLLQPSVSLGQPLSYSSWPSTNHTLTTNTVISASSGSSTVNLGQGYPPYFGFGQGLVLPPASMFTNSGITGPAATAASATFTAPAIPSTAAPPKKAARAKRAKAVRPAKVTVAATVTSQTQQLAQSQTVVTTASVVPNYVVRPDPAVPPNWDAAYNQAIHVLAPYSLTPVPNTSYEYAALAELVEPELRVDSISRVLNAELWKKFIQTRKELMSRKVEDYQMLQRLGLTEAELIHREHIIANFDKDQALTTDYSDNVALLFHGSRGKLDPVLSQGLDERLGNAVGGLLGRGIYFADDPMKSVNYDANQTLLLFAVLLGDCLNVDNLSNRNTFVREPDKTREQQRNHNDLFFDSITGRPASVNEFVIYNRYQCCPLYAIKYTRNAGNSPYARWRNSSPPFAWVPRGKCALPPTAEVSWPFFAQTIFAQMAGDEITPDPVVDQVDNSNGDGDGEDEEQQELIATRLSSLHDLGFTDQATNTKLLKSFNYDLERTIDSLIQDATSTAQSASTSTSNLKKMKMDTSSGNGLADGDDDEIDCFICYSQFPPGVTYWKELQCGHRLCTQCHTHLQTSGTTMAGTNHTFLKCPFCNSVSGTQIGTCPNGTMTVVEHKGTVTPGYEKYSTYSISYFVPGSPGVSRVAYVPGSPEGLKLIRLLKVAWDRRLCFSVGTSATSGAQNVLVWSIHHKTALTGGVQSYGYPDPTYLTRVLAELAEVGVQ